jgi:DNA-binding MarR family transcriptional regulator
MRELDAIIKERDELRKQLEAYKDERNNRKKLSVREVKEIRNLSRASDMTQSEIADVFAVNPATVSRILRGIYHK